MGETSRTEKVHHYQKASSILVKTSSIFQPIPPLAPKRSILMPPRDMPNLCQEYEHIRFMSHAVNFETEDQRLNESGSLQFVAGRDLFNNSLDQHQMTDSSSESDEERKYQSVRPKAHSTVQQVNTILY